MILDGKYVQTKTGFISITLNPEPGWIRYVKVTVFSVTFVWLVESGTWLKESGTWLKELPKPDYFSQKKVTNFFSYLYETYLVT